MLKNAKSYKRAAGFFSSTALIKLSKGISGLIKNNGKMQLVVSPKLSEDDINAIKQGYENKEKIIEKALIRSLNEELTNTEKDRLNLMISLIENGVLDIKIAILDDDNDFGMYHEKIGVVEDLEENKIAFTGSYNESINSYVNNFESLDVYTTMSNDYLRVIDKEKDFNKLWDNHTDKLKVISFPEAVKEELFQKHYEKEKLLSEEEIEIKEKREKNQYPCMTKDRLYDYQNEAIENWAKNNYVGIFDMATGTGKTYTGLGAATRLFNYLGKKLAIIIICPYTHLVDQWAEDLKQYQFNPIIGYGSLKNKKWKDKLKSEIIKYKTGISKYLCFITTNATFCSDFVQEQIKKIEDKDVLFIADEAHNLGAPRLLNNLNKKIKYRLALSATFERYNDEEGTEAIFDYFGRNYSIHYSLKMAIDNDKLTPYKYHPVMTYLSEEELEDYLDLTRQIRARRRKDQKTGKYYIDDVGKRLLLKRARLVAGSKDKMYKCLDILKEKKEEKTITNTLVYCGATTINDEEYEEDEDDEKEITRLAQFDSRNRSIIEQINYANKIADNLQELYKIKEKLLISRLQTRINEYIKRLYSGDRMMKITSDYKFKLVYSDDPNNEIPSTESQGLGTIKAISFMCGLLDIAKSKMFKEVEEEVLYPLVFDAPMSNIDGTHRKSIMDVLPSVASQIIIFTRENKDLEDISDEAKQKISSEYYMEKKSEKHSVINSKGGNE